MTRCRNTYNELPQELLDPQVPHLFPQERYTTRTFKLAKVATSTTPPITNIVTLGDHFS